MILHDVWELGFDFLSQKPIFVEPVAENLSTDAGLLVFRQWDEQQGLTEGFAAQLDDGRRDPDHSMLEMVRSRVFGIVAGYEDQNDQDCTRRDGISEQRDGDISTRQSFGHDAGADNGCKERKCTDPLGCQFS